MQILFTITLVIELLFGLGFIILPGTLFGLFGVTLNEFGVALSRIFGSAVLGFVVLMWYARSSEERSLHRAATATMFTYFAISTIFIVLAQIAGVTNVMGWANVGLHGILAIAFGWFLFRGWRQRNIGLGLPFQVQEISAFRTELQLPFTEAKSLEMKRPPDLMVMRSFIMDP